MGFKSSQSAVWKLANSSDVLTDLSAYVDSVDPSWEIENADVTTLGQAGRRNLNLLENHTITVTYVYDRTAWTHNTGIWGASVSVKAFELHREGTASTTPKESGNLRLTKISPPVKVGTVMRFTCTYKVDGVIN